MIELFRRSNATLTLGIVGNAIGEDKLLVDYLKNSSNIEIANHGWNHEPFEQFSRERQSQLMRQTNDRISLTFGVKPVTFIAPYNTFNDDTIDAMKENGLSIISAHFLAGSPKMPDDKGVYRLPTYVSVSEWEGPGGRWYSTPTDYTMRDLLNGVQEHGYSVVMLHPHDYDNAAEIEKLIDRVRASNLRIVTISEIANVVARAPVPTLRK